jgi:putative addiction module component (TIGR02574 family)
MNIAETALKLSPSERHALIGLLWDSLDKNHQIDLSDAKKHELDRRIKKMDEGKGVFVPAEEVQQKAKKLIDEIRG